MFYFIISIITFFTLLIAGFLIKSYRPKLKNIITKDKKIRVRNEKLNPYFDSIRKTFHLEWNKKKNLLSDPELYGNLSGRTVIITKEKGSRGSYLKISIYNKIDLYGDFSMLKESKINSMLEMKTSGNTGYKSLYKDFDEKMSLYSSLPVNLTALLNKKVTENVLAIYDYSDYLEITKEFINIKIKYDMLSSNIELIKFIIRTADSISGNLSDGKSLEARLIENIKSNVNENVRFNNLVYLTENFPNNDDVQDFLKILLKDKNQNMQITAAKNLKNEGAGHLLNVLEKQFKNKNISNPDIIPFFGKIKYLKSIPLLINIYKETDASGIKKLILQALKDFEDPSAGSFLVKELKNKNSDLRDEAVNSLGTCGKREAIEPLYKLGKSVFNPFTKNLIQEAISKIQTRLGPVDMGALSVAEQTGEDGALSITDDSEQGGLSMADDKDKEKKLSQEGGI